MWHYLETLYATLLSMETIGIVGGGQLGMMLAEAAGKLGFSVIFLDPTPGAPASKFATQIIGAFTDESKINELAEKSDYLTFEIELTGSSTLNELEKKGKIVHPSPKVLALIKDKYAQKVFLRENGIPVADFVEVKTEKDAEEAGNQFSYPYVLKAKRDSYDGKGNVTIRSPKDIQGAFKRFKNCELYAEKFVPFSKELAVMVARGAHETVSYPLVQTVHKNHICDLVYAPASVSKTVTGKALEITNRTLAVLESQGVFGIELFFVEPDIIMVNEIAPRVHNSGHYTIEACETSQFEQHIRTVTNMTLGSTRMKVPAAVMVNLLGEREGKSEPRGIEEARAIEGTEVHLYGKLEVREGRKMGHITAVAKTQEEAERRVLEARSFITL